MSKQRDETLRLSKMPRTGALEARSRKIQFLIMLPEASHLFGTWVPTRDNQEGEGFQIQAHAMFE